MTNIEETVLDSIKNKVKYRKLSPVKFGKSVYATVNNMYDTYIENLKSKTSKEDRIFEIVCVANKIPTIHYKSESYQCHPARRSALDVMRIYKYYFEDIDLFEVMRILCKLAYESKVSTMKCPTIHKQVFWIQTPTLYTNRQVNYSSNYELTELGITFDDWRNIGND